MVTADIDTLSINTVRVVSADMVRAANSGHPGAPMGCAPMAHALFSRFITANPQNPEWINRDRFVLSNGHGCALQYLLLHLYGYDLTMDDLKDFRKYGAKTPGHPENVATVGIEVTTGPLGQGIAQAVGLSVAQAQLAATFNKPGYDLFTNHTYFIVGDGCLQEGIASEAASLAGHLQLGNLIGLYDDNHITIDGDIALGFTEDVNKRFESYGWHVQVVEDGDNDLESIIEAIEVAKSVTDKPSLIKIRTTIGYGSKNQGEEKVHGSPLHVDDIKQLKAKFGFNPEDHFHIPEEVYEYCRDIAQNGSQAEANWNKLFAAYEQDYPAEGAQLKRRLAGKLPDGWEKVLPRYTVKDPAIATRKLSENALVKLADIIPELIGGSADLTGSNLTRWRKAVDFQAPSTGLGDYSGRYIRYGVREHAMAAVMNGLAAYGAGFIPYGGTFLNFITYAWGAVRLSALSRLRVIYVMTHDSIGLGEDGPTHQPVEVLPLCRSTPNMFTIRPADGNETSGAYKVALNNPDRPTTLILTRQNLPQLAGSSLEAVEKGAYVLQESENSHMDVIIVATGSEVSLAVDAAKLLSESGISARIVSMPSAELYDSQPLEYKKSVFPSGVPIVSIEASSTFGWQKYSHYQIGMHTFGISAPLKDVMNHFGFVPSKVADKVKKVVEYFRVHHPADLLFKP